MDGASQPGGGIIREGDVPAEPDIGPFIFKEVLHIVAILLREVACQFGSDGPAIGSSRVAGEDSSVSYRDIQHFRGQFGGAFPVRIGYGFGNIVLGEDGSAGSRCRIADEAVVFSNNDVSMCIEGASPGDIHGSGPARGLAVHECIAAARGDFVFAFRDGNCSVENIPVFIRINDAGADKAVVRIAEGAHVVNGSIFRSLISYIVPQRDGIFRSYGGHGQRNIVSNDYVPAISPFRIFSGGQHIVSFRVLLDRPFKGDGSTGGSAGVSNGANCVPCPDIGHLAAGKIVVACNFSIASDIDIPSFRVNIHIVQRRVCSNGDGGLVSRSGGHAHGADSVFSFGYGQGIQFHGYGIQCDGCQFCPFADEDGTLRIHVIVFNGTAVADGDVSEQPHGFLHAGSGKVGSVFILSGNALGKDKGFCRDFRPLLGCQRTVISQQYFTPSGLAVAAHGAQVRILHRHGSRAEVDPSVSADGFRLTDQDAGIFIFINGCRIDGACRDERGIR